MKYKNAGLSIIDGFQYYFIKYEDCYQKQLDELKELNSPLAKNVEECPKIYSELSDHQCYMIFKGKKLCVGAIYIGTSFDEKNIELELHLIEKYFESKNKMVIFINKIIEHLSLANKEKENIEIELINKLDLSLIEPKKYKKLVYDANLTTYRCPNLKFEEQKKLIRKKDNNGSKED